jgi:hypothetical protein
MRQLAIDDVKIGAADRTRRDRDQHFARLRPRRRHVFHRQPPMRCGQHLGPHQATPEQANSRINGGISPAGRQP